jgi:hypothetical protein
MPSFLGISDSELRTIPIDSTIGGVLQNFGNDLQKKLIQSLKDKGAYDSGNLAQTIVFGVEFLGQAWEFQLKMDDYGTFIDEGVEGVGGEGIVKHQTTGKHRFSLNNKPSASHFRGWAERKGINMFAVRESVFRKGIKANKFYTDVVNESLIDKLVLDLEKAGAREIAVGISEGLKGRINGK